MGSESLRDKLRSVRPPQVELPIFEVDAAPDDPIALATAWLGEAIDSGAGQPNTMTLSTAGADGVPSARTLLLKDVTAEGFWFATLATSPKGVAIAANPSVAVTLYWPERGRQIRVSGVAEPGPREVSNQDFLARHPLARAQAIAGDQSEPMPDSAHVSSLLASASELIAAIPDFVPPSWTAYVVRPRSIEFWQATANRDQLRLRYLAGDTGWSHERIWP